MTLDAFMAGVVQAIDKEAGGSFPWDDMTDEDMDEFRFEVLVAWISYKLTNGL